MSNKGRYEGSHEGRQANVGTVGKALFFWPPIWLL